LAHLRKLKMFESDNFKKFYDNGKFTSERNSTKFINFS